MRRCFRSQECCSGVLGFAGFVFFVFLLPFSVFFFPQTFQTHRSFACLQFTPQKNRYFPAQLHFVMFRFKCCFVNALFPCVTSVPRGRGGAGGGFFYFLKIKLACEQFFLRWCFPSRGCMTVCLFFLRCSALSKIPYPGSRGQRGLLCLAWPDWSKAASLL